MECENEDKLKPKSIAAIQDIFEIGEKIGKGSYSNVFAATNKSDGAAVALKIVDKTYKNILYAMNEIKAISTLKHPNIVNLRDSYENNDQIILEMDKCGMDLFSELKSRDMKPFSEKEASHIIKQVLNALKYIHSEGYIHRDVKAANILRSSNDSVKLIDFNLTQSTPCVSNRGTPYYMAPEIWQDKKSDYKSDIWAIGIIIHLLVTGEQIFDAKNITQLEQMILANPLVISDSVSAEVTHLLFMILQKNPTDRVEIDYILNHTWITHLPK